MKTFKYYLALLALQGVNTIQTDATPPERKLPEDGVEPDYDATPIENKHTFAEPLAMRQLRSIRATARIEEAKSTPLTPEDIKIQSEMEKILREFESSIDKAQD